MKYWVMILVFLAFPFIAWGGAEFDGALNLDDDGSPSHGSHSLTGQRVRQSPIVIKTQGSEIAGIDSDKGLLLRSIVEGDHKRKCGSNKSMANIGEIFAYFQTNLRFAAALRIWVDSPFYNFSGHPLSGYHCENWTSDDQDDQGATLEISWSGLTDYTRNYKTMRALTAKCGTVESMLMCVKDSVREQGGIVLYTPSYVNGSFGGDSYCEAQFGTGFAMATEEEVVASLEISPYYQLLADVLVWVQNDSNNCNNWNSGNSAISGNYINYDGSLESSNPTYTLQLETGACDSERLVACIKR